MILIIVRIYIYFYFLLNEIFDFLVLKFKIIYFEKNIDDNLFNKIKDNGKYKY
jgi:hypothetical protein